MEIQPIKDAILTGNKNIAEFLLEIVAKKYDNSV